MNRARVAVIMPCHNAAAVIERGIASVIAQSFRDWELVVVDDGSTDDSAASVRLITDGRLRLLRQANRGPASARNHGLSASRAPYVAFLDADDTWAPTFLERMHRALETYPKAVLAYCGWQNRGIPGGRGRPFVPPEYEGPDKLTALLQSCRWPIHGAMVRRETIDAVGGFDETLWGSEDFDLWLRVATRGPIVRVEEVLAFYHHGDTATQLTRNRARQALCHWRAQRKFLAGHPDIRRALGRRRTRTLLLAGVLRAANECHWNRDLPAARRLFRTVMRNFYGSPRDWVRMLPSILPLQVHRWILTRRDHMEAQREC